MIAMALTRHLPRTQCNKMKERTTLGYSDPPVIDAGPWPFATHVTTCVEGGRWQEYTVSTTSSTTLDEADTDPETATKLH